VCAFEAAALESYPLSHPIRYAARARRHAVADPVTCSRERHRAQVVPGKFVAMKGPKTLGPGMEWRDGKDGYREFSPAYYADILHEFGVQASARARAGRRASVPPRMRK
jgi:hypothetical protein